MSNIDKQALREVAEKATPGRIGDRIDGSGSIKYQCFGNDGSLVLQADHKNMEYGFIGGNSEADELFFRLCDPAAVLALLDELEPMALAHLNLNLLCDVYRSAYEEARHDGLVNWETATSLAEENSDLKRKLEAAEKTSAARLGAIDTTHKMFQRERDRAEKAEKHNSELSQKAEIYDMLREDYGINGSLVDFVDWQAKRISELEEKQRLIDICQGQGLEHRIAAEKRAESAENRIAELENQLKAAENNEIDARCRIAELEESHAQVIHSRDHYKRMCGEKLRRVNQGINLSINGEG